MCSSVCGSPSLASAYSLVTASVASVCATSATSSTRVTRHVDATPTDGLLCTTRPPLQTHKESRYNGTLDLRLWGYEASSSMSCAVTATPPCASATAQRHHTHRHRRAAPTQHRDVPHTRASRCAWTCAPSRGLQGSETPPPGANARTPPEARTRRGGEELPHLCLRRGRLHPWRWASRRSRGWIHVPEPWWNPAVGAAHLQPRTASVRRRGACPYTWLAHVSGRWRRRGSATVPPRYLRQQVAQQMSVAVRHTRVGAGAATKRCACGGGCDSDPRNPQRRLQV